MKLLIGTIIAFKCFSDVRPVTDHYFGNIMFFTIINDIFCCCMIKVFDLTIHLLVHLFDTFAQLWIFYSLCFLLFVIDAFIPGNFLLKIMYYLQISTIADDKRTSFIVITCKKIL